MKFNHFFCCAFLAVGQFVFSQRDINRFLKPSDTLNFKRQQAVIISETVLGSITLLGLNQLWYANYPQSNFHFINDNDEWLQVDKVGHFYSSYQLGRFGAESLAWSGASSKKQLVYGASLSLGFMTAVEVLDGFSSEWGASSGDLIANVSGTALYVSQELLWMEQRITPKFSFHSTKYAEFNPNALGGNFQEQFLKDYNGQTYWLSVNVHSFTKDSTIPKWLNIALGYGAEGMVSGKASNTQNLLFQTPDRFRQFYLSLDVDLTKIETKSHFLKTFFSVFNTIKIPAPTLEYSSNEGLKGYFFYF